MSLDLVEIALDQFTDWVRFEKLAAEIMRDEGYPDIKPLGGVHDAGQDAVVERFFYSVGRRMRIVFQFTLRPDVAAKVQETIKRLDDADTAFQKLVIVTPAQISSERQQTIKKQVTLENQVDLEIYERKTLINRLADFSNGIFQRYFPDIRDQVNRLLQPRPGAIRAGEDREREFLKVSYAFTFAPGATRTRKSIIDETVLAVLSLHSLAALTPEQIIRAGREALSAEVLGDLRQVEASLGRLKKRGSVDQKPNGFCLSAAEVIRLEAAQASLKASQRSVVSDIVAEVCNSAAEPIADTVRDQLTENAREVLVEYFRMNGLELAQSFLSEGKPALIYLQGTPRLLDIAKCRVSAYLGELLVAAIGKALCTPTADEAQYFANCSRAYIGLQVMNVDPSLREFQTSRFSAKVFVLDTDVVLGSIIGDLPVSGTYRNLISRLVALGASVVIPDEVLEEVS
ncbi:MAG: hypothetical protein L0214_04685, partial [candidate division NC10 bacterium]|nr:hypothetical protein [candidate division NC10 bacterium]